MFCPVEFCPAVFCPFVYADTYDRTDGWKVVTITRSRMKLVVSVLCTVVYEKPVDNVLRRSVET